MIGDDFDSENDGRLISSEERRRLEEEHTSALQQADKAIWDRMTPSERREELKRVIDGAFDGLAGQYAVASEYTGFPVPSEDED